MLDVSIVAGAFLLAASSMSIRAAALTRGLIVVLVALCVTQARREGFYWQFCHRARGRSIEAGHSFGGAAAVALAETETRVRAAVNIDGTLYGSIPDQALAQPFLLIESDRAETKHGQRFLDGHVRLLSHARGPTHRWQITRAKHYSVTDAPRLLSSPRRWAVSLIVGGTRGLPETVKIANDLVLTLLHGDATDAQCQNSLR